MESNDMRRALLFGGLATIATACAPTGSTQPTQQITYSQVVNDTEAAYTVLRAVVGGLVASGKLDKASVATAELGFDALLEQMKEAQSWAPLNAQTIAQKALSALTQFQSMVPTALLPGSVLLAIQLASLGLVAFIALDPGTAKSVIGAEARLTVRR